MNIARFHTKRKKGFFVEVSPEEALTLAISLTSQVHERNPNRPRSEHYTTVNKSGHYYFSIGVDFSKE